jgi:hypothetical protein
MEFDRAKRITFKGEITRDATSSTTNPTWPELGSNPDRRAGTLTTGRLRCCRPFHPLCYQGKVFGVSARVCVCAVSGLNFRRYEALDRHIHTLAGKARIC